MMSTDPTKWKATVDDLTASELDTMYDWVRTAAGMCGLCSCLRVTWWMQTLPCLWPRFSTNGCRTSTPRSGVWWRRSQRKRLCQRSNRSTPDATKSSPHTGAPQCSVACYPESAREVGTGFLSSNHHNMCARGKVSRNYPHFPLSLLHPLLPWVSQNSQDGCVIATRRC